MHPAVPPIYNGGQGYSLSSVLDHHSFLAPSELSTGLDGALGTLEKRLGHSLSETLDLTCTPFDLLNCTVVACVREGNDAMLSFVYKVDPQQM